MYIALFVLLNIDVIWTMHTVTKDITIIITYIEVFITYD